MYNFYNSPSAATITLLKCAIPLQRIDQRRTFEIVENKTNDEKKSQTNRLTRSQSRNMTDDERANSFISLQVTKRKIGKRQSTNEKLIVNDLALEHDKENICPKRKLEKTDTDRNINPESIHPNKKQKIVEDSDSVRNEENTNQSKAVSTEFFRPGQVVWAKLRGFPCWPAKIERICGDKKQLIEIFWFNDYRRSKVFRSQIFDFHKHFAQYAVEFENHIGLDTAAKEALIYLSKK